MNPQTDWAELLCFAKDKTLVLQLDQAFCIFPDTPELSLSCAILTAIRNFTSFQVLLIVEEYSPLNPETPDEVKQYLEALAALLRHGNNPYLFLFSTAPLEDKDTEKILAFMSRLPEIPKTISEKISIVHKMRQTLYSLLITLISSPSDKTSMEFYRLSARWMSLLKSNAFQYLPVKQTLEYAGLHLKQHTRRIDHHTRRGIEWGREFDDYYRKYLDEGICEQTARAKARKDFIANHPQAVTDTELLFQENFPGTTRQSLRKYHAMYLRCKDGINGTDTT